MKRGRKESAVENRAHLRRRSTSSNRQATGSRTSSSSSSPSPSLVSPHEELRSRLLESKAEILTLSNATWEATHWKHTVYLHSRVMFLGEIDLKSQSFGARFDLHVMWDPDSLPEEMEDFNPIIRFPEAITWRENARVDISGDSGGVLNGHRSIIEGRFRTHMNLEMFPFDAQALKVEMQLGNFALTLSFTAMGQPNSMSVHAARN